MSEKEMKMSNQLKTFRDIKTILTNHYF